jgi:hypothetical protein
VGDISLWPNIFGWFVMTPTYMVQYNSPCSKLCLNIPQISEKAANVIIVAMHRRGGHMVVQD